MVGGGSSCYPVDSSTLSWRLEARHTMTELNNPDYCEQSQLCEHLLKYVGDESGGLLMAVMQIESEWLCGECPHYKAKNESPT